jgi:uncharacterized membrane protein
MDGVMPANPRDLPAVARDIESRVRNLEIVEAGQREIVNSIREDVQEIKGAMKTSSTMMKSVFLTVIAGLFVNIVGAIVIFLITRGT